MIIYTMKQVCGKVGISYETLRFYCNEGLVPGVARDKNNYRMFDDRNVDWLLSLQCLKRCGMSIADMKNYRNLCLGGAATIPERKQLLAVLRRQLVEKVEEINGSIGYIDNKQRFFDDVLSGKIKYTSNLIKVDE